MPVVIFFACLDLERKSSLINKLIDHEISRDKSFQTAKTRGILEIVFFN